MPKTYEPIATQTASGSTSTITFSSIPATYTDLVLVTMIKLASGTYGLRIRFNGDSGTNYSNTFLWANGSSVSSAVNSTVSSINLAYGALLDSTNFWISTTNVMSYSNSSTYKTTISRDNDSTEGLDAISSLWRNTAAITQIDLTSTGSGINFASGSTFTLYGIKAA